MKNYLITFIILLCLGCEEQPELNGKWVILKMHHKGKEIYPQTDSEKTTITYNVAGYEGAEKITFKTIDSTAILPGFKCDEMKVEFKKTGNKIRFELANKDLYQSKQFGLSKEVFLQKFELITQTRKYILELESDLTFIELINEEELIERRINNLLK